MAEQRTADEQRALAILALIAADDMAAAMDLVVLSEAYDALSAVLGIAAWFVEDRIADVMRNGSTRGEAMAELAERWRQRVLDLAAADE